MTHTKTPHKHRDIIKAYADDRGLCAFVKRTPLEEWKHLNFCSSFLSDYKYFLCLPKHKDAVLNLLNGGESEAKGPFCYWLDASSTHPAFKNENPQWFEDHWYMLDEYESRIKPKKVKRVIATYMDCNGILRTTDLTYDSPSHLMRHADFPVGYSGLTLHEIEIQA